MITSLGRKRSTLTEFYAWQGTNGNPAPGTVNYILGFSTNHPTTHRYTFPVIHKDSTVDLDNDSMPVDGTIVGVEKDVIFDIDNRCPPEKIPTDLLTEAEYQALNWVRISTE